MAAKKTPEPQVEVAHHWNANVEIALYEEGRFGLERAAEVADERAQQVITLTTDIDASLTSQKATIVEQAAEIARLEAIIEGGGGVEPGPGPEVRPPDLYFLPAATGDGSGSSPENAAVYSALPSKVAPGKVLGLIGDRGNWASVPGLSLSKGGTEGEPCVIMGCDGTGAPYMTVLASGRAAPLPFLDPTKYTGGSGDTLSMPRSEWAQGARSGGVTLFTFKEAANFLQFNHFKCRDIGSFGFFSTDQRGHRYSDINITNCKHGWWMEDDPGPGLATERCIQDMLWERFEVDFFEEDCFRWRGLSHHLTAQDFDIRSRRCMGNITFGFNIGTGDTARNDKVTDWIIRRGKIRECHDQHYGKPWCDSPVRYNADGTAVGQSYAPLPGKVRDPKQWDGENPGKGDYWNGDGVSAERGCDNGLIEDMQISGCSDAACDVKAGNVIFRRVTAWDNKRNFRLYAPGLRMEECVVSAARKRGGSGGTALIMLKGDDQSGGKGAELVLDRCTFKGPPSNAFSYESEFKYGIKVVGEETCTYDNCTGNPPPYVP